MATTLPEPPKIDSRRLPDRGSGNGGWKNLVPADGDLHVKVDYSPPPSSTAIWVVLFAITMMFAAFTSALVVRKGGAIDWQSFRLPPILYFNTLLLIASSITLELARRQVASFMGGLKSEVQSPARWLYVTLGLGLLFVGGQYIAWSQLRSEGLYLATNPSSSFFYLLTVTHALHVLGGLGGLLYVIRKLHKSVLRRDQLVSTARYWHFMGLLWVYLLVLLWVKV
ncbi:MAG TPA: cytochrome c oxidase subunit 3 [Candidatus Sulfotelmatobacter sp.]|jgi:cytochrome c oxidase subunit 3|nr:cytochrome c oxidase subunit 3 [Candidatus Sulfotelmatobacter sp.]